MSGWGTQCACRMLLISDVFEIVGKPVYAPGARTLATLCFNKSVPRVAANGALRD